MWSVYKGVEAKSMLSPTVCTGSIAKAVESLGASRQGLVHVSILNSIARNMRT